MSSLASCILDIDGRPAGLAPDRRTGSPDTRLMRYERRGNRTWFVSDDSPPWYPWGSAYAATRSVDGTDVSTLGEWAWWSAMALRHEADRNHEAARAARITAWSARMAYLAGA